jgi:hypothetical protein
VLVAGVVAALVVVAGPASPVWACSIIGWPSATFNGSVLRVDEQSSTVTFQVDELVSTDAMGDRRGPPIEWPAAGTTLDVGYPSGEAGQLGVGGRYRVQALDTVDPHLPWRSTALASYASDFSVGPRCGAVEHPALTTLVDGSSIESPARNVVRSSLATLGRWWPFVAAAVVVGGVAVFVVRRARRQSKAVPAASAA